MDEDFLDYKMQQILGADTHVKSLADRVGHVPARNVIWSKEEGKYCCYPTDLERKRMLEKYGRFSVSYDRTGEVDFRPFAEESVKISDMSASRSRNFRSADERLLKTEWAKKNSLYTVQDCAEYRKNNNLTWHERSDGITLDLVPTEINKSFSHSGGVAEMGAFEDPINLNEGIFRSGGKLAGKTKIQMGKSVVSVEQGAETLIEQGNEFINANEGVIQAAGTELIFVGVQNIIATLNDEKTLDEAVTDTAGAVGVVAVSEWIDEKFLEESGVLPQAVAVACFMKDSFMRYLNNEINEQEFVLEVVDKGVPLLAGKVVGVLTGGNVVAQIIATYACGLIYNEVKSLIKDYKSIQSMQTRYLAYLNDVADGMIEELQAQRNFLKNAFEIDGLKWNESINRGFDLIISGNKNMDMETIANGIDTILKLFHSEVKFRTVQEVKTFLDTPDRILKL